jgi:hypothetical protein
MALPNDSILITPGTGATVATELQSGKEYQVVMLAGPSGHIEKTRPTYSLWVPTAAVGASKLYADLFNAAGTGVEAVIHGLWAIVDTDTIVTGALGIQISLYRTSAVGTGGTAHVYDTAGTLNETICRITPFDTTNAALPAGVTARFLPTGGATISSFYWSQFYAGEETATSTAFVSSFVNMLPVGLDIQRITLNEGQGLLIKQGPVAATGNMSFLVVFSV